MSLLVATVLLFQLATDSKAKSGCAVCDWNVYCNSGLTSAYCLNVNASYDLDSMWISKPRFDCISTRYITDKFKTEYLVPAEIGFVMYAWMIAQCETNWDDDTSRLLCETQELENNIELFIPVSHNGSHFRNKYCAQCNVVNDLSELISWNVEIYCNADLSLSKNVLAAVKRRRCNIFVHPPAGTNITSCDTANSTTSECSLNGRIATSEESQNLTCNNPSELRFDTSYFCYICESDNSVLPNDTSLCRPNKDGIWLFPPFSAILDINVVLQEQSQESQALCDEPIQVYDPETRDCLELQCDNLRYLTNGTCLSGINNFAEMCTHIFFIKLTPNTDWKKLAPDMLEQEIFHTNLQAFVNDFTLGISIIHFRVFRTDYNTLDKTFILIQVGIRPNSTDVSSYIYLNIHTKSFELIPTMSFFAEMVMYDVDVNKMFSSSQYLDIATPFGMAHMKEIPFQNGIIFSILDIICDDVLMVHKLLVCPFLEVQFSVTSMKIQNDFLTIKNGLTTISLNNWDYKIVSSTSIVICLEDYLKIKGETMHYDTNGTVPPKQILAFVCVSLSISCLLITLVSYLLLSTLQSQPGINNVILCISLLLAQAFYQFGAGQTSLPSWACAVIGALCHFFWLTVMFSMNICSVEMYLVFKKLTKLPTRFKWMHTLRYLIYVVILSVSFVLINLVASFILSEGKDSGYGGSICYLSSPVLQIFTFVLPSAVTVVTNIVLFALVVFNISAASVGSANLHQERNYFAIYTRLSSIVGLTWLFGFLQLLLHDEVLEYIFIILNASQGVFIMVAFVVSKRTLSLYCKKRNV